MRESVKINGQEVKIPEGKTAFETAYDTAAQQPGQPVHFEGLLPSGYAATQVIAKTPVGENASDMRRSVSDFAGASILVSSSNKGTHVIGTFSELRAPELVQA